METAYKVMVTNDYEMFKELQGNRQVLESRVKKIIKSIDDVGYVLNPLIVNEKYEVIDGQGRLKALRQLEMPVYYIIVEGIGLKECQSMNINQVNWGIYDYIYSYAQIGNESYIDLLRLVDTFKKNFRLTVVLYALTGKIDSNSYAIKEGDFKCTREDSKNANESLSWLVQFNSIIERLPGHTEFYYMALLFCRSDPEVDNNRLFEKMTLLQANLIPVTTIQQALEQIESIYNDHARNKVYIKTNYRKFLDGKYGWYEGRYGDKYEN